MGIEVRLTRRSRVAPVRKELASCALRAGRTSEARRFRDTHSDPAVSEGEGGSTAPLYPTLI